MTTTRLLTRALLITLTAVLAGCGAEAGPGASPASVGGASPAAASESAVPTDATTDEEPPADAARLEDGATIVMSQFAFSEAAVVVPAGATLTFVNEDNVAHTVTEGVQGFAVENARFDEPVIPDASIDITFDEPGRYDVTCEPHPIMQMAVFVEG